MGLPPLMDVAAKIVPRYPNPSPSHETWILMSIYPIGKVQMHLSSHKRLL